MIKSWVQNIKSPWTVTVISILISEIVFIIIGLIFLGDIPLLGVLLSFIIPASSAYPISSILLQNQAKIEAQKNELEHLDKINKKLFTTISHDIKSPLANISPLVELIGSKSISEEEAKLFIKDLGSSVNLILEFLDDILKWSLYQINKKPLEPEIFDTEEVLSQSLSLYKHIFSQKKLTLKQGNLSSPILVDKGSYSFAIRNILQNAIKYTGSGGTIEIHVEEKYDHIITVISDNGIGMKKEQIERIKSKTNYHSTMGTDEEHETGFGLRTAIEYLEKQNGKLVIHSEKNSGTKISVILPVAN